MIDVSAPMRGVSEYDLPNGFHVTVVHWSSDPLKDEAWADRAASQYPRGRLSMEWRREYEMDDSAIESERSYFAYGAHSLVEPFPVHPKDGWTWYLGFDFGQRDPTAGIFIAGRDGHFVVFDSVYMVHALYEEVKLEVWKKIALHAGVTLEELLISGLGPYVRMAVGDPTGLTYATHYAQEPFPIYVQTKLEGIKLNDVLPGQSKVNQLLWPAAWCCSRRQMARDASELERPCAFCGKPAAVRPRMQLMKGRAPELEYQLERLVKEDTPADGSEVSEKKDIGAPKHAADAFRYICVALWAEPDGPGLSEPVRMMKTYQAKRRLSVEEEIHLSYLEAMESISRPRRPGLRLRSTPLHGGGLALRR